MAKTVKAAAKTTDKKPAAKKTAAKPKSAAKKTVTKPKTDKKAAVKKPAAKPKTDKKTIVKKPAVKVPAKKAATKSAAKTASLPVVKAKSTEALIAENLSSLSNLVRSISETIDVLVQKTENMAYHLIATEEVLAEVVANAGLDLAAVNSRIRSKIAKGTDKKGDPTRAIDIAASIASPRPKK